MSDHTGEKVPCGRARRKERHDAHRWTFQAEDDNPAQVEATCPGYGEKEHVDALFARAEQVERDALYSVVGRLDEGWTPDVRTHGTGSCWRWINHSTERSPEAMTSAESTVLTVARLLRATQSVR